MELYKTLYISIILHIIVLFLIGGIIRSPIEDSGDRHNGPGLPVKKAGIITAEIITESESENKKIANKVLKLKMTVPVTSLSDFYYNETIFDSGNIPLTEVSGQSIRNPDGINSYNGTDIQEEVTGVVKNKLDMTGTTSFYGTDLIRKIKDSIEKAKVYPMLARKKGIEGKVLLRFRVMSDGMVKEIEIVKGSGFEILDNAAVETIKKSAPLPYVNGWIEVPLIFKLE